MRLETSRTDSNHFSAGYGCGCRYVAWKIPRRNAETYGWYLCPAHMAAFQAFRQARRREFRIKHPCRCYYVAWNDVRRNTEALGWRLCPDHLAEYQRFQEG